MDGFNCGWFWARIEITSYAIFEGKLRPSHHTGAIHFWVIRLQFTRRWLKQAENHDSQEGILL